MSSVQTTEVCVIGAGPAGLKAAISARDMGARVTIVDSGRTLGGQLVKQTHKFFGSRGQFAGMRGIDIAKVLSDELLKDPSRVDVLYDSQVAGFYGDGILAIEKDDCIRFLKPERVVCATGARERMLLFENNDLPGVYGAGAVQTLMNVYGVRPGKRVLMVGAGNIGLIVSYQLIQAGVDVACVLEAMPHVGGYRVHAAKIKRLGVPILTSHTIKAAHGTDVVQGATVVALDSRFQPIPGSESFFEVDTVCLAVGLSPLTELLWQAGCKMGYVPELGGYTPLRRDNYETTRMGVFIAGDLAGIEEATSAMIEGEIAGLAAAKSLGYETCDFEERLNRAKAQLEGMRQGPTGLKVRQGLAKLMAITERVRAFG